jgi:tetratricopeptide (TPR) repeat protein
MVRRRRPHRGHALALRLLGNYLSNGYDGDIRKRDTIKELIEEPEKGEHAWRMMQAYRQWLGESEELDILYMMGLFDRPVEEGAIEVLKKSPAIAGLTERLVGIPSVKWNYAVKRLRELGLLAKDESKRSGGLDCHPLVREYFGERLKEENAEGWREAHSRLYEYYLKLPQKWWPDTLEEMSPLFSAITHGCLAGYHQEAKDEVFWMRLTREDEGYIFNKLGAYNSFLSSLSNFFDIPWEFPASGLDDSSKADMLNCSAFGLRAVGRLREAIQPMKAGLKMRIAQKDWESAALEASNLSGLLLTMGNVSGAITIARESVAYADRSKNSYEMVARRTTLADALHQSGRIKEAGNLYQEAEAMQQANEPGYYYLYSLQGFRFCEFLLELEKVIEVISRAENTLAWAQEDLGILDFALDHLTLGRAWLACAWQDSRFNLNSELWNRAQYFLDRAVTGLREAGAQHHLPRGLLARAAFYRLQGDFNSAWGDLSEANEIADAGDMKLHLCDYHLETARLCADEGKKNEAEEHMRIAEKLIEATEYFRRKKELKIKNAK